MNAAEAGFEGHLLQLSTPSNFFPSHSLPWQPYYALELYVSCHMHIYDYFQAQQDINGA